MAQRGWWVVLCFWLSVAVWSIPVGAQDQGQISVQRSAAGGNRYSMEFRDAELKDVLRAIGQERRLNLVISDEVAGKLTLSFQDVALPEALDAILRMGNLVKVQEGPITRIIKSPFSDGEGQLVTRMLSIQFASAKDLSESVKSLISKKGSVTTDSRTNTLIIRDLPESIERISQLVRQLDSKTPQVMIEARIVEANTNFTRELGVQWGGLRTTQGGNLLTTLHGGATKKLSTDTVAQALTGGIGLSGGPFAVNLPANVGPGHGGSFGITFGNLADTLRLDLQLSALEDTGKGKILSTPRILALDNKEAKISSGTEILIPVTSIVTAGATTGGGSAAGQTGVTTINAKLELSVTPHVTPTGEIVLHVVADKKDPDYTRAVLGIPPLTTRTAETDLLAKNGETVVIGGIYTKSEQVDESGVPLLSKIPFLGWLFKTRSTIESQNELLIFITPTIQQGL
ncbi:MAG: type IV pilus secretin PilQ [Nitrospirae bacterium]|nr:type IV pilus secretin PilQ [Nitrospirota bacterium]